MIRKLTVTEVEQNLQILAMIYQEAMGHSKQQGIVLMQRIKTNIEKKINTVVIGVFSQNQLIGFLYGFDFHPNNWWAKQIDERLPKQLFDWYEGTFELNELMVLPYYQNQGYGRAMIHYYVDHYPNKRILLGTAKNNNERVVKFYHDMGFKVVIDDFKYSFGYQDNYLILCRHSDRKCQSFFPLTRRGIFLFT